MRRLFLVSAAASALLVAPAALAQTVPATGGGVVRPADPQERLVHDARCVAADEIVMSNLAATISISQSDMLDEYEDDSTRLHEALGETGIAQGLDEAQFENRVAAASRMLRASGQDPAVVRQACLRALRARR